MYCNQGFKNLICSSSIFNKFLFYYLKSKTDYLNSLGKGTTFKEISKKIVENIYIPRPILLPEQQRIAHKLDTVLGRIGKAISLSRENLESLNTLFASLLQQAFDPLGKAENENLYELPEGWEWKPLAELCKFENGDRGKNYPSRALFVNEGIPVINASNLNGKTIDLHNLNFISEDKYNLISNGKVRKNDLLFCLRGSLGKCALVTNLDKGVIASSLVIVRPLERILNGYLLYYFNSSICHKFIRQYNNGAAQPNLSAHCLSKFLIPFSSLPEQRRIAHKLDVLSENIEAQKKTLQEKIDELNNLKNSILDAAFRGQL